MPRFFDRDDKYMFTPDEEYMIELNQNNLLLHKHRSIGAFLIDQVCVEDDRDGEWWVWYRYDYAGSPEVFETMAELAERVGTVVLRETPFEHVQNQFNARHQFTDEDWDDLLGAEGDN